MATEGTEGTKENSKNIERCRGPSPSQARKVDVSKDTKDIERGDALESGHCLNDAVCLHRCWLRLLCLAQPSWSEELGTGKMAAFPRFLQCDEDEVVFFSQGPPTM